MQQLTKVVYATTKKQHYFRIDTLERILNNYPGRGVLTLSIVEEVCSITLTVSYNGNQLTEDNWNSDRCDWQLEALRFIQGAVIAIDSCC